MKQKLTLIFTGAGLLIPMSLLLVIVIVLAAITGGAGAGTSSVIPGDGNISGIGGERMVSLALQQVGNVGGEKYWNWYGFPHHVDWCAIFVSWCADQSGYSSVVPKFAGCTSQGVPTFQNMGCWEDAPSDYVPSPGDIIFIDWDRSGNYDHCGIVERAADGFVYTIEGNRGEFPGECIRDTYALNDTRIAGYGTPRYAEVAVTTTAISTTVPNITTAKEAA